MPTPNCGLVRGQTDTENRVSMRRGLLVILFGKTVVCLGNAVVCLGNAVVGHGKSCLVLRLFISARPNYMVLQKGLISPIQKPNQQLFWLHFSPPFSPKVLLGVCFEPLLVLLRRDIQLGVVQVLETAQEHALISHRSPRDRHHMKQEESWDS